MSFRGGRGGRGGPGPGRGGRGAFPARGGVPVVVRGNVWTRDSAAATAPAARPPVLPQVAGVKRPREAEAADDDAGPATQRQKPALPELQDTLSRKLKEVRRALHVLLLCANLDESRLRRCACESSLRRSECSSGKLDSRQSKSAHVPRTRLHKRPSSASAAASCSLGLQRCVARAAPLWLSTHAPRAGGAACWRAAYGGDARRARAQQRGCRAARS